MGNRVGGFLSVSRAFGDFEFKVIYIINICNLYITIFLSKFIMIHIIKYYFTK